MLTTKDLFEPVWNGTLERAGLAPGLSGAIGASSLATSTAWLVAADAAHLEGVKDVQRRAAKVRLGPTVPPWDRTQDAAAAALCARGISLQSAARILGTTTSRVRHAVARERIDHV